MQQRAVRLDCMERCWKGEVRGFTNSDHSILLLLFNLPLLVIRAGMRGWAQLFHYLCVFDVRACAWGRIFVCVRMVENTNFSREQSSCLYAKHSNMSGLVPLDGNCKKCDHVCRKIIVRRPHVTNLLHTILIKSNLIPYTHARS